MKPYIFNNYEKTLPQAPRGYYTAFPASQATHEGRRDVEKVNGIQLTVDLSGVISRRDVFERFYKKLGFSLDEKNYSWDAFGDNFWFLKRTSAIFEEINPAVIVLRVQNLNHLWVYSEQDYSILCEILLTSTDNTRFNDGFNFRIEVDNDTPTGK